MIISIDIETYEYNEKEDIYEPVLDARKFFLGAAKTDKGKIEYFNTAQEMWTWLKEIMKKNNKQGKRTFIYGHNTEYDWYGIIGKELFDEKINYICFKPFIAIYNEKNYFLDTMAFYRMSLEKVGETLNFPKLEMPTKIKTKEELKPYLTRDIEITYEAIQNLKRKIQKLGFNPRKLLTAGQLAMTSFLTFVKRNYLEEGLMEYNEEKKYKEIIKTKYTEEIKQSYRGGNNTAYQTGNFENVTLIDIVALYAKAMKEIEFPDLRTEIKNENVDVKMLEEYMKERIGIAECEIQVPNIPIGYLPIRYSGYQIFPTNRKIKGTWTFLELKKAIQLGYKIIKCNYSIRWKKLKKNPLKEYIEFLHKMEKTMKTKEEKNPIKMLRNNLYGKFAQSKKNKEYKIIYRYEIDDWLEKGYTVVNNENNKYILVKEKEEYIASYVNPIISSLITAYSRDYLFERISKIPKEDLLYCDTDSIMFKGNHLDKFELGEEMGMFKLEEQGNAKILGEKRYFVNENVRISGIPKRHIKKEYLENEEEIIIKKINGLSNGIKIGDLSKIGSFNDMKIEIKTQSKMDLILPEYIDETKIKMVN